MATTINVLQEISTLYKTQLGIPDQYQTKKPFVDRQALYPSPAEQPHLSKQQIHVMNEFAITFRGYRYLTEANIEFICKKYDLIYGSVNRFLQEVPSKNTSQVNKFHARAEQRGYKLVKDVFERRDFIVSRCKEEIETKLSNLFNAAFFNSYNFNEKRTAAFKDLDLQDIERIEYMIKNKVSICNSDSSVWKVELILNPLKKLKEFESENEFSFDYKILANMNFFDLKDAALEGYKLVEKKPFQDEAKLISWGLDPIILAKFDNAYLLVTAWGDEEAEQIEYDRMLEGNSANDML